MLNIGTYVVKGSFGVCRVEDVVRLNESNERLYYLLVPATGGESRFYLPADHENLKVRSVVSREEAWKLMQRIEGIEAFSMEPDQEREKQYAAAVGSGRLEEVVSLLKYLSARKRERASQGKDLISVDRRYLQVTRHLLSDELSFVTGESPQAIEDIVQKALNA